MKLVASLIVKNEMGRYLTESVPALLEFCDEVRVLNDRSTDGSDEWLVNLDDRVNVSDLYNTTFFENEGAARQVLLDWTLKANPTHVLAIDADEFVADGHLLRRVVERSTGLWSLTMEEVWEIDGDCLCVRGDGGWRPHEVPIVYSVDASSRVWKIPDRKLACGRVPGNVLMRKRAVMSGTEVLHFGWTNEAERVARHHRYVVADGGRFHASAHLDSIMWPEARVSLEGREWPDALAERCERIVSIAKGEPCPPKTEARKLDAEIVSAILKQ